MNQNSDFYKIASNSEVMQTIFKFLSFEEQLKFAQVSQQLKYMFINFIWRVDYTKVYIIKQPPAFHIRNDRGMNFLKLTAQEFEEFVKLYGMDIEELKENCNPCLNVKDFPNLKSLSYINMTITKPHLNDVVKYLKNLESLSINNCTNKNNQMLALERDIEINTVLQMKNLKYLHLKSEKQLPLKYTSFVDLIVKSHIKHLNLFYYIKLDSKLYSFNSLTANSLLELEISASFRKSWYGENFSHYLGLFENLQILKLNKADDFTNLTIEILADNCKNLKELSVCKCNFKIVNNFNLLNSIESLKFEKCYGLTQTNLRQILSELNLLHFQSQLTDYNGVFEDFVISKKIQTLAIDSINTSKFKGVYENNPNLKSLDWIDDSNDLTELNNFNCPLLEHLSLYSGFISSENILKLRNLKTFLINGCHKHFSWFYFIQLLKDHNSLQEITLFDIHHTQLQEQNLPNQETFKCAKNIKHITISIDAFLHAIDFWFDLLHKNRQLKLMCNGMYYKCMIQRIIENPKFPWFLPVIYINGFKVACKDLRNNFDLVLDKIEDNSDLPWEIRWENKYGILF